LYRVIHTRFNRQNSPLCLLAKSLTCTVLNLQETLSKLNPISLQEIEGAKLMNRLDQKFLIRRNWIPSLLEDCKDFYRVLEVEGLRKSAYQNRFIETPAYASLNAHTRGRKIRFKARIRQYASNSKSFLEVKEKTVQGLTLKSRLEREVNESNGAALTEREAEFLRLNYGYSGPELTHITCGFNRITLVSNEREERITLDTDILFKSETSQEGLGELAIMEVKQAEINRFSPFLHALEAYRFEHTPLGRRTSMSKYVVGTLLLNPNLAARTYRSTLKQIERLRKTLH